MPTYVYECPSTSCAANFISNNEIGILPFERNVPILERDEQECAYCGRPLDRKVAFTGLTWAPTAGGMR